jgi:hypothetical protein
MATTLRQLQFARLELAKTFSSLIHTKLCCSFTATLPDGTVVTLQGPSDGAGHNLETLLGHHMCSVHPTAYENPATQEFPDCYYGDIQIEMKAYAGNAPAFDIGQFSNYCESIIKNPEKLNALYAVAKYALVPSEDSIVIIDVRLFFVWELAGSSKIGVKVQNDTRGAAIKAIRPRSLGKDSKPAFSSKKAFVEALAHHCANSPYSSASTFLLAGQLTALAATLED